MGAYKPRSGDGLGPLVDRILSAEAQLRELQRPSGTQIQSTSGTAQTAVTNAATAQGAAVVAAAAASTADGKAVTATTNAATAQAKADDAFTNAGIAVSAAGAAQTTADGKNRVWYQTTAPAGTGHQVNDLWFDTDDGNRPYSWNGAAWNSAQFGTNALADLAINAAKIAANAITTTQIAAGAVAAGNIAANAVDSTKLAAAVNTSITTAQTTANTGVTNAATADAKAVTATTNAATAQTQANTATTNAATAQTAANTASTDAAAAAGIANSKAVVLYQTTAPSSAYQNALTLWIDTTGGANTPKKWVSGTTWAAVTDKAATDAASSAATANTAAATAQTQANTATTNAAAAQTAANNAATAAATAQTAANTAQTTANGKNTVIFSTAVASGTAYASGDIWFQKAGAVIVGQWEFVSGAWAARTLDNAVIANIDAGKITAGSIAAARIAAGTITAAMIAADTITASQIAASAITASELAAGAVTAGKITAGTIVAADIAANTITAGKIAVGTITSTEIAAGTITAAKMVAGTITAASGILADAVITDAKIANLDAGKITTGFLAAARIDVNTLQGKTLQTAASGARVVVDSTGLKGYDAANVVKTSVGTDGLLTATGATINGAINATSGTISGDLALTGSVTATIGGGQFAKMGSGAFVASEPDNATVGSITNNVVLSSGYVSIRETKRLSASSTVTTPVLDVSRTGLVLSVQDVSPTIDSRSNYPLVVRADTSIQITAPTLTIGSAGGTVSIPGTLAVTGNHGGSVIRSSTVATFGAGWSPLTTTAFWTAGRAPVGMAAFNGKWTAVKAGWYDVCAGVQLDDSVSAILALKKNSVAADGNNAIASLAVTGFAAWTSVPLTKRVYLNVGDYLSLGLYVNAAAKWNTFNPEATYFDVLFVQP